MNRSTPRMDGSTEVVDTEVVSMSLSGMSVTGPVTVTESPSRASTGQLQGVLSGTSYPASSFFDVYVDAVIPASGSGTVSPFHVHNEVALHLVGTSNFYDWPPPSLQYTGNPSPCAKLLRNVVDPRNPDPWLPAQICITSASFTITGPAPAVGGVAELSGIEPAASSARARNGSGVTAADIAAIAGVIAMAVAGGSIFAYRRNRR